MSTYPHNSLGLVKPQSIIIKKPLELSCGLVIAEHKLVFESYGTLNETATNAVLVCHALSGNHHAAGWYRGEKKPGWWDHYIGPDKPIDTAKFFVICPSNIGTCYGSTGPHDINPKTRKPWGPDFPSITIEDWVDSQNLLMEYLSIDCWAAVVGGSLGAMQAMRWSVRHPEKLRNTIIIASAMKLSAQNIAFNEMARRAIKSDPDFRLGNYADYDTKPIQGLALARMIGHVTYLSDQSMGKRFGRELRSNHILGDRLSPPEFQVESYLRHQGEKFAKYFDANSYILLTKILDYFDFSGNSKNNPVATFKSAKCKFLVVSFTSDWRFPIKRSREIVDALIAAGKNVSYAEIESDQGHDAFLLPNKRYEGMFRGYLALVANSIDLHRP